MTAVDSRSRAKAEPRSTPKSRRRSVSLILLMLFVFSVVGLGIYIGARHFAVWKGAGVKDITATQIERSLPGGALPEEAEQPAPDPAPAEEPKPESAEPEKEEEQRKLEPIEVAMQQPPGSLSGSVTNEQGEKMPAVSVSLQFEKLVKDGKKGPDLKTETDDAGAFAFPEVPPGKWTVLAEHLGYGAGTVAGVSVKSEELTEKVEVVLPPALTVTGTVKTATGSGLEGARISLFKKVLSITQTDGEIIRREIPYRETISNAKGEFKLERSAPGNHAILVSLEGFATERLEVALQKEGKNSFTIELVPSASIGGLVRTTSSKPIAGANVSVADKKDKNFKQETVTRADGSFIITGLRANRMYDLTAKAENFAPAGPFEIPAGRTENIIILESGGSVSGLVTNTNTGGREANIPLVLESAANGYQLRLYTTSDSSGEYRFVDLPSGTYNIRVQSTSLTSEPKLGVKVKIPEETKDVNFSVYPGKTISGFVAEGETGYRISNATVTLESRIGPEFLTSNKSETITDQAGSFSVDNLPYGMYTLSATAEGYMRYPGPDAQAEVRLVPGEVVEPVTLLLSPGGTITGTVIDSSDSPVEGAVVQLFNTPGAKNRINTSKLKTVSGTGGQFEITGIPLDKEVNVTVSASVSVPSIPHDEKESSRPSQGLIGLAKAKSEPIVLTPFLSTADVTIRLGTGAPLIVRVRDENKTALPDANVSINHSEFPGDPAPPEWSGETNSLGEIVFNSIPDGRGSVSASKEGYIGGGASFNIEAGKTQVLTVLLEKGHTLEGYAYDDAGIPIQEGYVDARAERGSRGGGRGNFNNRGYFKIEGVSEGTFTLNVYAQRQTSTGKHTVFRQVTGVSNNEHPVIEVPMNGRLDGSVMDQETLEPITNARVNIQGDYEFRSGHTRQFKSGSGTQNPPGEFTFRSIPPGEYDISVSAPNYLPYTDSELTIVSPGRHWAGKILLQKGSILKGRIVSAQSGEPVIGASIKLDPSGLGGKTNGTGEFTISAIPPDIYDLTVSHNDFLPRTVDLVHIKHGKETDIGDIELEEGGKLYGTVSDGFGRPVSGALVTVRYVEKDESRSGRTDAGGVVTMQGLKPGAILITVTANFKNGKVTKSFEETVSPRKEARFDIVLSGELTLHGTLYGPNGSSVSTSQVDVYPLELDDKPVLNGRISAQISGSTFRAEGLTEGRYLVLASGSYGSTPIYWHGTTYVAHPGGSTILAVPTGRIKGRVYDTDGAHFLPGMEVRLRGLSFPQSGIHPLKKWWEWTTVTDQDGLYRFNYIPPGTYELVVRDLSSTDSYLAIVTLRGGGESLQYDVLWE